MKKFIVSFVAAFMAFNAHAAVDRLSMDIKLPTQKVIEVQNLGALAAASTTNIKSGFDGPSSAAAVTLTSFTAQPDVPRNIQITPGGTTTDVEACSIVVSGTDYYNQPITETFAFLANASTATVGAKAFKTVTSVFWPANCESGGFAATWSIGQGEKIGLKNCLDTTGDFIQSSVAGVFEATRATLAADPANVSGNTADFNGTMNSTNVFRAYFMQNFRCLR